MENVDFSIQALRRTRTDGGIVKKERYSLMLMMSIKGTVNGETAWWHE